MPSARGHTATIMFEPHSHEGKGYDFAKQTGQPCEADGAWAARWEERSHLRDKPNQVHGWKAGTEGSLLEPPAYQKLEGPWINGKDPATA